MHFTMAGATLLARTRRPINVGAQNGGERLEELLEELEELLRLLGPRRSEGRRVERRRANPKSAAPNTAKARSRYK